MKNIIPFIYLFSFFLFCYEIPNNYSVVVYPHVVFNTSLDTIFMRDSTDFSYHSSDTLISYYPDDSLIDINPPANNDMAYFGYSYPPEGYFDLSLKDTFHIRITGISKNIRKLYPFYDTSEAQLVSIKIATEEDSTYTNEFSFKAKKPSKGYISFLDQNYDSIFANANFLWLPLHSKITNISYCISTPEKVNIKIDTLEWSYLLEIDGSDTVWMLNRVSLKGQTNAFSLVFFDNLNTPSCKCGEKIYRIPVNKNGLFSSKIEEQAVDKNKFELYIQAFPERDKKITLVPPKSKGEKSE